MARVLSGPRRRQLAHLGRGVLLLVFSALLVLYVAGPVAWLVSSSLQSEAEITAVPPNWLPPAPTLANFDAIFTSGAEVVTYETRRRGDPAPPQLEYLRGADRRTTTDRTGQPAYGPHRPGGRHRHGKAGA